MYFIFISGRLAVTENGPLCFDTDDEADEYIARHPGMAITVCELEAEEVTALLNDESKLARLRSVGDGSEQVPL
jgi:hypothetical protein